MIIFIVDIQGMSMMLKGMQAFQILPKGKENLDH